jgi:hypothetical protein
MSKEYVCPTVGHLPGPAFHGSLVSRCGGPAGLCGNGADQHISTGRASLRPCRRGHEFVQRDLPSLNPGASFTTVINFRVTVGQMRMTSARE